MRLLLLRVTVLMTTILSSTNCFADFVYVCKGESPRACGAAFHKYDLWVSHEHSDAQALDEGCAPNAVASSRLVKDMHSAPNETKLFELQCTNDLQKYDFYTGENDLPYQGRSIHFGCNWQGKVDDMSAILCGDQKKLKSWIDRGKIDGNECGYHFFSVICFAK